MVLEKWFSFYFQTAANLTFCRMEWKMPESFFLLWKKKHSTLGSFCVMCMLVLLTTLRCSISTAPENKVNTTYLSGFQRWRQSLSNGKIPSSENKMLQNVTYIQFYDWSWRWEDLGVTVKCFVDVLNLIFKLQCLKLFQAITFTRKLLNCEQQYIQVVKFHIMLLFWQGE